MHLAADNIDDLLRKLYTKILHAGNSVRVSRGETQEIIGVILELKNIRSRISRTETRGRPFSAIGELLWYLTKDNRLDFIVKYIPKYSDESMDDVTVHGGYGPRLFAHRGQNQMKNVINLLSDKPTTRRAVIQLFDAEDMNPSLKEVPCTTSLQFLIRDGKLHLLATMRSNDAWLGLPHDIFCFTMIQEMVAVALGVEVGAYRHFVSSMHLYPIGIQGARKYLSEGVQRRIEMPPMPPGEPWGAIRTLLGLEQQVRRGMVIDFDSIAIAPYWADLLRLIQVHFSRGNPKDLERIKRGFSHEGYKIFIDAQLGQRPLASYEPRQGALEI